jgi:hypothetical protein
MPTRIVGFSSGRKFGLLLPQSGLPRSCFSKHSVQDRSPLMWLSHCRLCGLPSLRNAIALGLGLTEVTLIHRYTRLWQKKMRQPDLSSVSSLLHGLPWRPRGLSASLACLRLPLALEARRHCNAWIHCDLLLRLHVFVPHGAARSASGHCSDMIPPSHLDSPSSLNQRRCLCSKPSRQGRAATTYRKVPWWPWRPCSHHKP